MPKTSSNKNGTYVSFLAIKIIYPYWNYEIEKIIYILKGNKVGSRVDMMHTHLTRIRTVFGLTKVTLIIS